MATQKVRAQLPRKLHNLLFAPARYKVAHGGRGGAKSWGFARALLVKAAASPLRILCARELQNSIQDSVHQLLKEQIDELGLSRLFDVQQTVIRAHNGSEFIFSGLRTNITKVKSMEGVDIVWIEEAEMVSDNSWKVLIPTIRKEGSEIWVTFNPREKTDPTYKRFVLNPPPGARVVQIGWRDNPWLPDVLKAEKDYLYSSDPEAAAHVWGGETMQVTDAQVLRGRYAVESFDPGKDWNGPYYGADWGFSVDPTTLIRCWVYERTLYIEHEAYGVGVDLDDTPALFDKVPGSKLHALRADNSRPETIAHMRRHGFPRIIGCVKGKGSVEDGVEHLRSYEKIVIHPRCLHAAEEARLWSYKVDAMSGDVLPVLVDKHDHCLVGETPVDTIDGPAPISSLVGTSGVLATGERYHSVRMTSPAENVYAVRFNDGSSVTATAEHMFMTTQGWCPVAALTPGTRIVDVSHGVGYAIESCAQEKHRNSMALRSSLTSSAAITSRSLVCTSTSGTDCAGPSRRECTSTTSTATRRTMPSKILRSLARKTTSAAIGSRTAIGLSMASGDGRDVQTAHPGSGMDRQRDAHGTLSKGDALPPAYQRRAPGARSAALTIGASSRDGFAQTLASLLRGANPASISFQGNALCVGTGSASTKTSRQRHATGHVEPSSRTVVAVEPAGVAPVFNLEAEGSHVFTVCGGLATHNCWDATRYALEPIIRAGKPRPKAPPKAAKRADYSDRTVAASWKIV